MQYIKNFIISILSFFGFNEVAMSQTMPNQELEDYAYHAPLNVGAVFCSMLTDIEIYRGQFCEADFTLLQNESRSFLASRNKQRMISLRKLAQTLASSKHITNIDDIETNEFAQNIASLLQKQEALESSQNDASLQRALKRLSPSGQTLLNKLIVPGNDEKRIRWQKVADEAPALLKDMYASLLMQFVNKPTDENHETQQHDYTGAVKSTDNEKTGEDVFGFEVSSDGNLKATSNKKEQ
jgi:hypothetical protein